MPSPDWLATATGWVPALHLPNFSGATVERLATFLVTGEVAFGGKDDLQELSELTSMLHLLFQVRFLKSGNIQSSGLIGGNSQAAAVVRLSRLSESHWARGGECGDRGGVCRRLDEGGAGGCWRRGGGVRSRGRHSGGGGGGGGCRRGSGGADGAARAKILLRLLRSEVRLHARPWPAHGGRPPLLLFTCEHCSATFTTRKLLKQHINSQHNETGFLCPRCKVEWMDGRAKVLPDQMQEERRRAPRRCRGVGR